MKNKRLIGLLVSVFLVVSVGLAVAWKTEISDNAANDAGIFMPVPNATAAGIKSYAAGTVIKAVVANHAGGATNTLYLFGFLY